ncbi:MAG: TrkH family potassium uptake protein, partial [Burkholderiaceae bacterium]|nr:TrkH family potassium uptake protein [Burkholderiaceae bacterium]
MYNFLPVFAALSRVLIVFSVMFLVPWAWSWWGDEHRLQEVWLGSFGVTLLSGLGLMWYTQSHRRELMPKDGFMLVNLVWAVLPAYAALPLWVGIPDMSWTDAYFEAVSGLTATGATVLSGLDTLPLAINVWRCFLQLFGGLGIMLLVVAILPLLGLGGVQLYKAETPGPMKDAKLTPRIAETARGLWGVYFVLSASCFLAYRWAGMSWSDAFMHMSTTVSLGGFSSHDASLGFWDSTRIESVAMVFMLLAGVSFARYFIVWRSRSLMTLVRDVEVRAYFGVLLVSVGLVSALLAVNAVVPTFPEALRVSAFQIVSLATTTGYSSVDYALWPAFAPVLLVMLGCFVSCAGSTGGGIKMVRMIMLVKQARRELIRAIHPRVVNPVHLGGQTIANGVLMSVMAFMLIYGATILVLTMLMLYSGLDIVTA